MEEEPVNTIRETNRNLMKLTRRIHRDEESDVHRRLENLRITTATVQDIANKLKNKSSVSVADLQNLRNALGEDPKNVEVVLNTNGALRGLVRELSGSEASRQYAAAGCCCNIAHCDARAGTAVGRAAGAYLVTALNSLSSGVAAVCAYAVGNVSSAGARPAALLAAQGALAKLCALLRHADAETRDAALYALSHAAAVLQDELGTDHLNQILAELPTLPLETSSQLLFILSCHREFGITNLTERYLNTVLQHLPTIVESHNTVCNYKRKPCCILTYLLRILANLRVEDVFTIYVKCFSNHVGSFREVLQQNGVASDAMYWLLGNMYNYGGDNELFRCLLN